MSFFLQEETDTITSSPPRLKELSIFCTSGGGRCLVATSRTNNGPHHRRENSDSHVDIDECTFTKITQQKVVYIAVMGSAIYNV